MCFCRRLSQIQIYRLTIQQTGSSLLTPYHIHARPGFNMIDLPRRSPACRIFTNGVGGDKVCWIIRLIPDPELILQGDGNKEKCVQDGGQQMGMAHVHAYPFVVK